MNHKEMGKKAENELGRRRAELIREMVLSMNQRHLYSLENPNVYHSIRKEAEELCHKADIIDKIDELSGKIKNLCDEQGYVKDFREYVDVVGRFQSIERFANLSATKRYLESIYTERKK